MDLSIFQPLLDHIEAHAAFYIAGAVMLLPLIYFTKRYSVPLILYTVEIGTYLSVIHFAVHYIVAFIHWFKEETDKDPLHPEVSHYDWETPLSGFWIREKYHPDFLFLMEIVFAVLIVVIVFRFRPMKIQQVR